MKDYYLMKAKQWGCTRYEAKIRILSERLLGYRMGPKEFEAWQKGQR